MSKDSFFRYIRATFGRLCIHLVVGDIAANQCLHSDYCYSVMKSKLHNDNKHVMLDFQKKKLLATRIASTPTSDQIVRYHQFFLTTKHDGFSVVVKLRLQAKT